MIPFLKNLMKYLCREKIIFLFGVLIILLLSVPYPASAGFWDMISNAILAIPTAIAGIFLILIIYLTGGIAYLMGSILDWVISPGFISFSYTKPDNNPIIQMGLNITQSFVNMILVVILVYVALSIALRIGEHDAKKIFAKLIVIALLVNFAPVFCGLIVDAANITMNYFLEPIQGGVAGILTQTGPNMAEVGNSIRGAGATIANKLGLLTLAAATIFLNLAIAFAFFLFAGLFIFRYIAIWVLVILSPLAFAFWIFPEKSKIHGLWDMWWNNFIQWSIIGIPIAFFLYLGLGSYSAISVAFKANLSAPEIEAASVGSLNTIFPFFVVVVFLVLGFVIGLATSAMGATGITSMGKAFPGAVKKYGKTGAKWSGKQAFRGVDRLSKGKISAVMEKQATAGLPGFKGKSFLGKVATGAGYATGINFAAWGARRGIGAAGLRMTEAESADIKNAEKNYENATPERLASGIRDLRSTERTAALRQTIEQGKVDEVKKLLGPTANNEINKIGNQAIKGGLFEEFKKIRDAFPHLAEEMGKGFSDAIKQKAGIAFKDPAESAEYGGNIKLKIVAKMKPSGVPNMDGSCLTGPSADADVKTAVHTFWTGEHLSQAVKSFGKSFLDDFHNEAAALGGQPFYDTNNPRLGTYLKSGAAQGLGLKV